MIERRYFLKKAGAAMALLSALPYERFAFGKSQKEKHPICYFTKHLQWLDYDDLGLALKESGFDGADLTVRDGGHVEPARAANDLPKAVASLKKHGISVPMVVTRISDPGEIGIDTMLKALSDNGVRYYRMGYLNYDYSISIPKNIANFHTILGRLADLNSKHNICGVYQNHAGTRLGASIWDLLQALKGIDPDHLGCQFDVRHATYEGGRSWENDFRAISGHIRTTVVKDFHWIQNDKGQWTNNNTLMGRGMVDFDKYFQLYKELKIEGPISNHSEYPLLTKEEAKLSKAKKMDAAIGRLRQDVEYTKNFLNKYVM
jgi:sugar phosphate isomerase/epimerase